MTPTEWRKGRTAVATQAPLGGTALAVVAAAAMAAPAQAQEPPESGYYAPDAEQAATEIWTDSTVVTEHTVTIQGEEIPYEAETGTQPVFDDDGKPIASVFYVAYRRTDVDNREERPLSFSFNGGPGSASVWMHVGFTGPRFLEIDDEGFPVQPYGFDENPHSVLDVTDIVYVDPVNTGFSRIVGDADREQFFGVNQDVAYLADWIDTYVSRNDRWGSPKYLIGESYGSTRVAGLAHQLQSSHWMFLNGVILVSPTGLSIDRSGPVGDAITLPYMAATAWYHDQLDGDLQGRDLEEDLLPEVEEFTVEEYIPALTRGGDLSEERRNEIAEAVSRYSGIDEQVIRDSNLAISTSRFWKELMRHEGRSVGRLDSRYRGVDRERAGDSYDHDPALTAWNHSFAPAINMYLRGELDWDTDLRYWVFGPVHPWDRSGDTTGEDLREAMAQNPFLHLMVQSGYYDGATDYFSAKYTMWNMDPSGKLQDRMRFEGYESGHMMYLRQEDLETSNQHIREFIQQSIPEEGVPAAW